jgi:uncharacterized protein DUF4349
VSPLELVDDRFDKLSEELRASRPLASAALRERVAALGPPEPARRGWSFRSPPRRLVLGLAGTALLASFVAAGVTGLGGSEKQRAGGFEPTLKGEAGGAGDARRDPTSAGALPSSALQRASKDLAPNATRLQRYDASLRLRVKDINALSSATKSAMRLARSLGGYVASVEYTTRNAQRGGATLVLRVPIAKVQDALGELTSLGTILQQRTAILDVTRRAGREELQIAKLERQLAAAGPDEAPAIRLKLKTLRTKHARLVRSARFARISLGLVTPAKQAAAAPTRFDRTVDDAGAVLLRELEILLYALVVAGPLLLVGGAGIAIARTQRRRSDNRLLERT